MDIKIKKLSPDAITPSNTSGLEAGYDLYAVETDWIRALERKLFKTNIALEIPDGYYGRIADRSGNAYKLGLHVMGGVIDQTYRGDIGVILYNTNCNEVDSIKIEKGQRIAQIIIEKCHEVNFVETDGLNETSRNEKGFGSSGL